MAVYTHLSNDDIAQLLQRYDLGELRFAVGIAEGVENSNYLLECEKGKVVTKYILTIYEKRVDPDELPFFLGLMEHLSTKGFPCPLPVCNREGEAVTLIQERPSAIVSFMQGRSRVAIKNHHVVEVGRVMAEMHVAADDFTLNRANALSVQGWQKIANAILPQLDTIENGLSKMVEAELEHLTSQWPWQLPQGVIHADMFPDNVFFEGKALSGVIDFYFACQDILAYEIAIGLNCWCFEASGEFNMTKAGQMIRAYDAVRPLSDEEKNALPLLARGGALRFLLTRAYDWVNYDAAALVTPHDPMEYVKKLRFQQGIVSIAEYGI